VLPNERKKALVLSGGGGRGAYHVGVLRFLHEHEWWPDVVVGTSIGAVNGAALASGHNPHSLWALWKRLTTSNVQKANLFNPLSGNFLLDTSPLRETLSKDNWVDLGRINSPEASVHLRITATEVDTGRLHIFGNSEDKYDSSLRQETITVDHIISSCSIPLVYPATKMTDQHPIDGEDQVKERVYWDGATVSNTPLAAAIDAGAEDIIVVLMTPWDDEANVDVPDSLIQAAGLSLDWALLASFRSDLKMLRRVNQVVQLLSENQRLRAIIEELVDNLDNENAASLYADVDKDGIPDVLEDTLRILPDPVVVSPRKMIPVEQIVSYTLEGHQRMYDMGYEDARRAWIAAGRQAEGGLGK